MVRALLTKGECDANAVWVAAKSLGSFGLSDTDRSSIVGSLRERLGNSDEQVQAITALGAFAPEAPDPSLIIADLCDRLKDPAWGFQGLAAALLGASSIPQSNRPCVVAALGERLQNDPDSQVWGEAAAALAKLPLTDPERSSFLGALRERLKRDKLPAFPILSATLNKLAVSEEERTSVSAILHKRLEKEKESAERAAVSKLLGEFAVPATDRSPVITALLNRLNADGDADVRKAAAGALGALAVAEPDRTSVVTALRTRLDDEEDTDVRDAAAAALLELGPVDGPTLLAEWRLIYEGEARRSAIWRARGTVATGAPDWPDPIHVLVAFLGHRSPVELPWEEVEGQPHRAVEYLKIFDSSWPDIVPSPGFKIEAADRLIDIVQRTCSALAGAAGSEDFVAGALRWSRDEFGAAWRALTGADDYKTPRRCWTAAERDVLISLQGKLTHAGLASQATVLQNAIKADASAPIIGLVGYGVIAWTIFWVGLIAAFPYNRHVRAVYLFNEKLRGMLSLWFVPVVLGIVPGARRHLLRPFRSDLLRDARIDEFDESNWFPSSEVLDRGGIRLLLADAVSRVAGICLLVGELGLGKTLFLRRVAKRSYRPLVFLYARACVDGVPEAIVQATRGVQDPRFFEAMIYTGSLAVIIDGLNEVSAEARGKILEFVKRNARDGNILVSTQPLEWGDKDGPPVPGARILELQPLARGAMEDFLLSRPAGARAERKVHGTAYQGAVREFLRTTLDEAPSPDEGAAAQIVLSNPMDLTYASELISAGLMPRPDEMVGQAFELARRHYVEIAKREFPTSQFAKRVVDLRLADRNWLETGDFANEQASLETYRLLVRADILDEDGRAESRLRFRHDKVMDFFLKLAFDENPAAQIANFDDPRFRGVYLLYAQTAEIEVARHLRDQLVLRAATTRDHALSDEFVRRLSLRDTGAAAQSAGSLVAVSA